jgi:phospholipid/cholesterol/gamma-HCH transport system substrate-binding protein
MIKNKEIEVKVGIFVAVGAALTMLAILALGSTEQLFSKQAHYSIHFPSVEGLIVGAKVVLAGVNTGTVTSIEFDGTQRDVEVKIAVNRKFMDYIRSDSYAEIATQGVLGDKMIVLHTGSPDQPMLADNSAIEPHLSKDLTQFLTKGDQLMSNLTSISGSLDHLLKTLDSGNRSDILFQGMASTAHNLSEVSSKLNQELDGIHLKKAVHNLQSILEKIDDGSGTVGALINDPSLYDDAKALFGGANRNRIVRNLIRQTVKSSEASGDTKAPPPEK